MGIGVTKAPVIRYDIYYFNIVVLMAADEFQFISSDVVVAGLLIA